MLGDGAGHLTKVGEFGTRDNPVAIAVADFNLDGKPDLATADYYSDGVSILLNQSVTGDPLVSTFVLGQVGTVYRWGAVPGAVYDVIRGRRSQVVVGPTSTNLGPVTCLANDLSVPDTANLPDGTYPPVGDAYFYLVRSVINGVASSYTVSSSGKIGTPSSGDCAP
jgi:hypothetical protein